MVELTSIKLVSGYGDRYQFILQNPGYVKSATVRACFLVLRQLRSVRNSLPHHALLTLITALAVSKVDYCNSVLARAPGHLLDRLQSVLNITARLIFSARKREHITPLLHELHWLRVPERIKFQLRVLAYRCHLTV